MSSWSLRELQASALLRMLNFNAPLPQKKSSWLAEPSWKVLVYDRCSQDVISPLLSVRQLRDAGVTLHLPLLADKEPVGEGDGDGDGDVPAVYLLLPTEESVARVCRDLRQRLYGRYHLNFLSAVSRAALEEIASAAVASGCAQRVAAVYDQHLNFLSLEEDLLVLAPRSASYQHIVQLRSAADPREGEGEAMAEAEAVADGLFCLFVMLGAVPLIRCPRGGAAERAAIRLDRRLRENLRDAVARNRGHRRPGSTGDDDDNSINDDGPLASALASVASSTVVPPPPPHELSFRRPLLLLTDREQDLATPLHHARTYQALIHDLLDLQLNRVSVETAETEEEEEEKEEDGRKKKKKKETKTKKTAATRKTFELCASSDRLWRDHRGSPLPELAAAVQAELEAYRTHDDKVRRLKTAMGLDREQEEDQEEQSSSSSSSSAASTAALSSALGSLPELLERKRLLALHTDVSTALYRHVRLRRLDEYFELERRLLMRSTTSPPPDGKALLELLADPEAGTPQDKMRLFLIYYISAAAAAASQGGSSADHEEEEVWSQRCEKALREAGCDLAPLRYVRRWKEEAAAWERKDETTTRNAWSAADNNNNRARGLFSRVVNSGSQLVMEGVRNLVVPVVGGVSAGDHSLQDRLPLTRTLDALMEARRPHPDTDGYRYFDPKTLRESGDGDGSGSAPRYRGPFQEGVVFVVGGGNYVEYQDLLDHARSSRPGRRVVYGCSRLLNGEQFLEQLAQLGRGAEEG